MKLLIGALMGLGCLLLVVSSNIRTEITRKESEWSTAFDHVHQFEGQIPATALAQNLPQTLHFFVPKDHHWALIARHLYPRFFIILDRRDGYVAGPRPLNPLEPFGAEISVNQVATPLGAQYVRNEWGYAIPIQLGDRIDLRFFRLPVDRVAEGSLTWGVEFSGDKEDHPGFGWAMSGLLAGILFWCGIGVVILGTLIVLLREPPKAMAPVDENAEV